MEHNIEYLIACTCIYIYVLHIFIKHKYHPFRYSYIYSIILGSNYPSLNSYMDVSKNNGTPKSSILIRFSNINHLFSGTPIFGNTHMF